MGETPDDSAPQWASPGFSPQPPAGPPEAHPVPGVPSRPLPSADEAVFPEAGASASHAPAGAPPGTYTFPSLEPQPLEPMALASLLTSPISPLGLGLGVGALRKIRRSARRGRSLAIAGVLLSSVFLAGSLLTLATFALDGTFSRMSEEPVAGDIPASRSISPVHLAVGNCVATLPVTAQVGEVTVGPCAEDHQLQVIDRLALSGSAYPGTEELFEEAQEACAHAFSDLGAPADFTPWYVVPSEENWAAEARHIICFARSTAGPVRGDLVNE